MFKLTTFSTFVGDEFGCGEIDISSMQVYETMRWTLSILNQYRGMVHGAIVNDSFVPGVQIGTVPPSILKENSSLIV